MRTKIFGEKQRVKYIIFFIAIGMMFLLKVNVNAAIYNRNLSLDGQWTSEGKMSSESDVYFYQFQLSKAGAVTIDYQAMSQERSWWSICNQDMSKEYSRSLIEFASETNPLTDTKKFVLEAGLYIIKIEPYNDRDLGTFRLRGSFVPANNNELENNNGFTNAMMINSNSVITGLISEDDDMDFYKFNLQSKQRVTVTLKHMFNRVKLSIWDKDYKQLYYYTFEGGSEDAPETDVISELLEAGDYYIKVEKNYYATGRYNLSLKTVTPVESIKIAGKKSFKLGKSTQLAAQIFPNNATNQEVIWSSNSFAVAVSSKGVVTAKQAGTAVITATSKDDNSISASYTVVVIPQKMSKPIISRISNDFGNKTIKVKWKPQSGAYGYNIQYCTNNKFKKAKNIYITDYRYYCYITAHKKLGKYYYNVYRTKIQKKTYYIRVRAYVSDGSLRYYGDWSKVGKIKIK